MHPTSEKKLNPLACPEEGSKSLQYSDELLPAVESGEIIVYLRAQPPVTGSLLLLKIL